MDDDFLPLLLIVLAGGAAVWFLMNHNKGGVTTTPAPPPCTVGGSYGGVGLNLSCSAVGKGVNAVKEVIGDIAHTGSAILSTLPVIGGGSRPASLEAQVKLANDRGVIWASSASTGWRGSTTDNKLPAGYKNVINNKMNPPQVFLEGPATNKFHGVAVAPPASS